ncbi:MAG: hypothetical protein HGA19_03135 [Oscillochloris sp.]|nr:hypothetical protein [Oscillochloris sp.]
MRKGFWLAFWSVLSVVIWRGVLVPARLQHLRVNRVSNTEPASAGFSWGYSAGARPQSIIFDLTLGASTTGSITTDGEATEAEVPLGSAATGAYHVTATATYRILGIVYSQAYRFMGTLPA